MVCWSNTVWNRSTYTISCLQISKDVHFSLAYFIWHWPYFTVHYSCFFCWSVFLILIAIGHATIFGVWNDCKVLMSVWQLSSDHDLSAKGRLYLKYVRCTCMSCRVHIWPWPHIYSSLIKIKFSWLGLFLRYEIGQLLYLNI